MRPMLVSELGRWLPKFAAFFTSPANSSNPYCSSGVEAAKMEPLSQPHPRGILLCRMSVRSLCGVSLLNKHRPDVLLGVKFIVA